MEFKIFPIEGGITAVEGVFADGINVGLKKEGLDFGFLYFPEGAILFYRLTTNRFKAAPLQHLLQLAPTETSLVLVNSKNANAMTGEEGLRRIGELLTYLRERRGGELNILNPFTSSTGVIGVQLPVELLKKGIDQFNFQSRRGDRFGEAIRTTDSFRKEFAVEVETQVGKFRIGGVAKGAGMIAPGMATMLAFIATDLELPRGPVEALLTQLTEETFNSISVDGDMSTNDSLFLFGTRKVGWRPEFLEPFREGLRQVMLKLALDIVRDGEGATKLVVFNLKGAKSVAEAKRVSKMLANSLLVKTALFGEDPNWGRIAATVGASGVEASPELLTIKIGDVTLYRRGEILMTPEVEERAHQVMKGDSFKIEVDLGIGEGEWTCYGCDLSYEYVKINAEYRT